MLSKVVDLTLGFKVLNGENWKAKSLFLDKFVAIFGKKYGSFSPKLSWRILLLEFVSGYFKTKKEVPFATKLEVGGGGG